MQTLEKQQQAECRGKFRSMKRATEFLSEYALKYCAQAKKYSLVIDWPAYYKCQYVAFAIKKTGTQYLVYCEMDDDMFRDLAHLFHDGCGLLITEPSLSSKSSR